MKKYLITGFLTLLPLALTFIIAKWLFDLFTTPFLGLVEHTVTKYEQSFNTSLTHHDAIVVFTSRVVVLVLLFVLVLVLGFFARRFFMKALLGVANKIFLKIPIVKTIYKLTKEVTHAVFAEDQKTFKQTVLVPFPMQDTHAIGFITGNIPPKLKKLIEETDYTVFVPTAPHPISGFLLMAAKKDVKPVDVPVEEAFKFLISCGVLHPGDPVPKPKEASSL